MLLEVIILCISIKKSLTYSHLSLDRLLTLTEKSALCHCVLHCAVNNVNNNISVCSKSLLGETGWQSLAFSHENCINDGSKTMSPIIWLKLPILNFNVLSLSSIWLSSESELLGQVAFLISVLYRSLCLVAYFSTPFTLGRFKF